jgi:hypothetical protein
VSSGIVARRAAYLVPGPKTVGITLSRSPCLRWRSWTASTCAGALVFGAEKGGYSGWSSPRGKMDEAFKRPQTLYNLRRTGRTGLGIFWEWAPAAGAFSQADRGARDHALQVGASGRGAVRGSSTLCSPGRIRASLPSS